MTENDNRGTETLPAEEADGQPLTTTGESEHEQANESAEDYLRLLQRERADFANYRRRTEDERLQQVQNANTSLLLRLLPILDDFERAIQTGKPEDLKSSWAQGIQLVERNFRAALKAEGLERIEPQGMPFNPWEHEAVSYQAVPNVPEGHVAHVVRPGYRRGDRIIRPAQVVVAGSPGATRRCRG